MIKLQIKQIQNVLIAFALMISTTVNATEVESPVDMLKRTSDDVIQVLKEKKEEIDVILNLSDHL